MTYIIRLYISICLYIHPSFYLSNFPYIYPSIHSSIFPSIYLFMFLSFYLPIHQFIYPSIYLSIHLSFHSSIYYLFIYLQLSYISSKLNTYRQEYKHLEEESTRNLVLGEGFRLHGFQLMGFGLDLYLYLFGL